MRQSVRSAARRFVPCARFGLAFSLAIFGAAPSTYASGEPGPASVAIMPLPRAMSLQQGSLKVDAGFTVQYSPVSNERLGSAVDRMLVRLDRNCGGLLRTRSLPASSPGTLQIEIAGSASAVQTPGEDESYQLTVTLEHAGIAAANELGAMHGMETLLQLVTVRDGSCRLPAITIDDAPRFGWRGFMLDVSRHFEPVAEIERTLDGMALVKLNVFHWHLSDDQGFRAESKKFPRLTSAASNGEFYTQEQMRAVVAYARARGIRVVPEFDMPGHSTSWILAYPEYGAGEHITALPMVFGVPQAELDVSSEKTYKFLDALIGEMGEIFPDPYFHIGGDEVEGKGWLENPHIAAFMKQKGFAKPPELQAYFNQRLLPILTKNHKKMIGWDEILNPALPKNIVIQSWRGEASLAQGAEQGFAGLLSAPYYLDAEKTSQEMFLADPVPADTKLNAEQQKLVLGGEVAMWSEQIHYETVDSRVWPRTAAIAERFWSPQADRDVADMYRRLRSITLQLEDVGLTHITGPERLRRNLAGALHPEALDSFAGVLEPVSFSDRYDGQKTDGLTSLDRLVDAVVADPPSRQQIAREVDEVIAAHGEIVGSISGPGALDDVSATQQLRSRCVEWMEVSSEMAVWSARSPRMSDVGPRAQQLGALAEGGLQALAYLRTRTAPPSGWKAARLADVAEAAKPAALVKFTFLDAWRRLIEAAAAQQ